MFKLGGQGLQVDTDHIQGNIFFNLHVYSVFVYGCLQFFQFILINFLRRCAQSFFAVCFYFYEDYDPILFGNNIDLDRKSVV